MDYQDLWLYIAGRRVYAGERETLEVLNPATGSVLAGVPIATSDDLDEALQAASDAFPSWRRTPVDARATVLKRAADLLRGRASDIGRLITLEQGKPLAESMDEVQQSATILEWFAEEARRAYGRVVPSRVAGRRDLVLRQPVGPVAAFTPWNFPMTIAARKVGAILAVGCTCVLKPAEETPAAALALTQALIDAGLPDGALSVVFGVPDHISAHLVRSEVIRKATFTGSTSVGRQIASLAAEGVKPVTMELGGHAPVLVFEDADLDKLIASGVAAKYRNAGQTCINPTRFYVQEGVYDKVVRRFAEGAATVKVGDGLDRTVQMGPLANARRAAAITSLVEDAVGRGAKVRAGGQSIAGTGNFWEPTVLQDVDPMSRAMLEEPFGPLALFSPFDTVENAIEAANRLPFGLGAYAFTTALDTAHRLAEDVETGMLAINHFKLAGPETPFGGVKLSGYGSEGGTEGLAEFLQFKLVSEG
ncbi:NAD-dependent succinate-semialdehyde dehydrogenase [Streptomyces sp. NBC_00829]|uniref:NAD-dependent succinate-semialdehyde dehydrogenase n=1 Tax=Streptomyces sp. NBC_00829 TaxID=2903679 RepID=UPI003862DF24|nr:NAD-dependent succinate-semialdehyde dehydrogenase [Streptomyces sp. NBC_00829]